MAFAAFARIPRRADDSAGHLSVGLDVTTRCALPESEVKRRLTAPPVDVVMSIAESRLTGRRGTRPSRPTEPSGSLPCHDPLAAAVVFDPGLCAEAVGRVTIGARSDSPVAGKAAFAETSAAGATRRVARDVDAGRFLESYLTVCG